MKDAKVTIDGQLCTPLKVKGIRIPQYFISPDGDIWSGKGRYWRKMTPHISGGTHSYAKTSIQFLGEKINLYFHKAVCEALVPFPRPREISKVDWDNTPESVKQHMKNLYFVNHKDHDRSNYHPSNLEWVTSQENAFAYQEHRKNK